MMTAADTRPMMATTTMISISEKPPARIEPARAHLLIQIPVSDVGIFTFAAFLALGSEGIEIEVLAVRSRENVLVRIAPGIHADARQVTAFAPVAHRRIVGTLHQRLQTDVRARILVVVQLVHGEAGFDGLDVALGLGDL